MIVLSLKNCLTLSCDVLINVVVSVSTIIGDCGVSSVVDEIGNSLSVGN